MTTAIGRTFPQQDRTVGLVGTHSIIVGDVAISKSLDGHRVLVDAAAERLAITGRTLPVIEKGAP